MHILFALFGNPEDVAAKHTLTKKPYQLLASWLRCAEAMLRRLLLIEAAAFPKPNTRPLLWAKRPRTRTLRYFQAEKPEDWRVSFRCFDPPALAARRKRRGKTEKRFYSAWPLAERYEALLRVFENPEPFARRLARRLHAVAHRIRDLFRADPNAQHRVEHFEALNAHAETAARHFDSS